MSSDPAFLPLASFLLAISASVAVASENSKKDPQLESQPALAWFAVRFWDKPWFAAGLSVQTLFNTGINAAVREVQVKTLLDFGQHCKSGFETRARKFRKSLKRNSVRMARPEGFEPPTLCSGGTRSIHLSYGRAEVFCNPITELTAVAHAPANSRLLVVPKIVPS